MTKPTLSVFPARRPNGAAVLIVPGGSYSRVVVDKEGFETARLLAGRGIASLCAALIAFRATAGAADRTRPLQDGQRALRLVRSLASDYKFDPARRRRPGFSAGGHLAASLATRFGAKTYEADDHGRQAFGAARFRGAHVSRDHHGRERGMPGSRDNLLGKSPSPQAIATYSAERSVTAQTPPTFLCAAADDATVPVANTLMMFSALKAANVPAEMHVFEAGGHGFGLRGLTGKPVAAWPDLFLSWASSHKMV